MITWHPPFYRHFIFYVFNISLIIQTDKTYIYFTYQPLWVAFENPFTIPCLYADNSNSKSFIVSSIICPLSVSFTITRSGSFSKKLDEDSISLFSVNTFSTLSNGWWAFKRIPCELYISVYPAIPVVFVRLGMHQLIYNITKIGW